MDFLYQHSLSGQVDLDASMPSQDIYLLCQIPSVSGTELYRMDTSSGDFIRDAAVKNFTFLAPIPGDDGILLEVLGLQKRRTAVRTEDGYSPVYQLEEDDPVILYYTGIIDGSGKQLLMYAVRNRRNMAINRPLSQFYLLKYGDCTWPDCDVHSVAGLPLWSPDGKYTLVQYPGSALDSEQNLTLGDNRGNPLRILGMGSDPFRMDDQTFGFATPKAVMGSNVGIDRLAALFTFDQLIEEIADQEVYDITLDQLEAGPPGRNIIALLVRSRLSDPGTSYLFLYDKYDDSLSLVSLVKGVIVDDIGFSPDGRWLTFRSAEAVGTEGSRPWSLHLFDLTDLKSPIVLPDRERRQGFEGHPYYDWSADGRWLLRTYRGHLDLIDTHITFDDRSFAHHILVPPTSDCIGAVWVNRWR